jgi:hypothetical protein
MKKNNLIKVCLIIFLLSMNVIFYFEKNYNPDFTNIRDISLKYINKNVFLKGEFVKLSSYKNISFATFKDKTGLINLTVFDSGNLSVDFNKTYIITGKINIYKNEISLIVKKIKISLRNKK